MRKLSIIILGVLLGHCQFIYGRTIFRQDGHFLDVNAGIAAISFIDCFGDSLAESIIADVMNLNISNDSINKIYIICDSQGKVLQSGDALHTSTWRPIEWSFLDSLVNYLKQNQVTFWRNNPYVEKATSNEKKLRMLNSVVNETMNAEYWSPIRINIFDKQYVSKEKYQEFCVNHKFDTVEFRYFDFYKHVMDSLSKIPEDSLMRKWGFYD